MSERCDKDTVDKALEALYVESVKYDGPSVKGYDFSDGINYEKILSAYAHTGFQATNFAKAVDMMNDMLKARDEPFNGIKIDDARPHKGCTIYFGFTSNMISCGLRETIKFLAKENVVDVMVTTCGAIEEDLMKCFAPHQIGSFDFKGSELRSKGLNRIGNLIVPSKNYCLFEAWCKDIIDEMHTEQIEKGTIWSPSKMIKLLGSRINDERSVLYWASKNNIPVFCPAITDGAVGDILFVHSFAREGFIMDIAQDVRYINQSVLRARKTGMLILGGGVVKHHIANANLMRNGADFCVYINTAQPFDGSDAGATPDEAVSWGKIRANAKDPVKVYCEATLIFPLIVAQTFAKYVFCKKDEDNR